MQIVPSMHIKSPEAIIAMRGGVSVPRATRCNRRVAPGQPTPAAASRARQPSPACGPRVAARRAVTLLRWLGPRRGRARRPCSRTAVSPATTATGIASPRRSPRPTASSDAPAAAPGCTGGPVLLTQGAPVRAPRAPKQIKAPPLSQRLGPSGADTQALGQTSRRKRVLPVKVGP